MPRRAKSCEWCGTSFVPSHSSVKCCSLECRRSYREKHCPISDETRQKLSASAKKWHTERPTTAKGTKHSLAVGEATKGTTGKVPASLLDLSTRTVRKILQRLNLSCSRCGWNEGVCDIHHIRGKKIEDPHNHSNLTYICPNCHRLAHAGKLKVWELKTLKEHIGDTWKDVYYG